jgi:Ethanolamine utilisation protein EutQ
MPSRMLGADEGIYVLDGAVTVESDGQSIGGGTGALTYMPAGSIVSWHANGGARLLIFHFPGGFDRALAGGHGQDALVIAWLQSTGTRFLHNVPLAPAALDMTVRR